MAMNPPSMMNPTRSRFDTADMSRRFSDLYFGYASNLAPSTMKGRCPDSLFVGLARLDGWRWNINSTGYANIVSSPKDHVYGALFFLSPRDEAGLDESEGVPWMYEKKWLDVVRLGDEDASKIPAIAYVDTARPDEGKIMPDYIVFLSKAIRETRPLGLPEEYIETYLRKYVPVMEKEDEEREIEMVRITYPRKKT